MSEYDLIVIGGGVNGAGIARDAAQRGLKVVVFEQKDPGAGTSGASSGMIHGGIRYLEKDRDVTRHSCEDSGFIQAMAPHLLFRIPFLFPVTAWTRKAKTLLELAFVLFQTYDQFQPLKRGKRSAKLTRDEAFQLEPGLAPDIVGAVTTDEWAVNVFRLCILTLLDAQAHGAEIQLRHKVERFLKDAHGRVIGVEVRDLKTGFTREVRGRVVFNATGPWAGTLAKQAGAKVPLRPGKGIHLVYDRRFVNYAIIASAVDGREVFLEPYGQETWIGTTDDDYYGDPAEVQAHHDEVAYLIQAVETVFPRIRDYRLVRAFAGVRPTLARYGPSESDLSRAHQVFDHEAEGVPGLMSMGGGKLAAYRFMAEEATDAIVRKLGLEAKCQTHRTFLPGGEETPDPATLAAEAGIDQYAAARMIHRHGSVARRIVERIRQNPLERRILCVCEPVTEAEAKHCIEHEWVSTLEDLRRRTHCGAGPCQGARCARRASWLLAAWQGGGEKLAEEHLERFVAARFREQAPVLKYQGLPQLELTRWALRKGDR
ncbi:MAG: glycerol-3-phosphate dehydrogenase/oxidase [bacterium]